MSPARLLLAAALAARAGAARVAAPGWPRARPALPAEVVLDVLSLVPPIVATCCGAEDVALWQGSRKAPLRQLVHGHHITSMRPSAGGRLLMTLGPGSVAIWDAWTGRRIRELPAAGRTQAQIFPDEDRVVVLGPDCSATIWSARTGEVLLRWALPQRHREVRVLRSGVATGVCEDHAVRGDPAVVWSTADGRPLRWLAHAGERIGSMEASPCGRFVATAGAERISVWEAASGRLHLVLAQPLEALGVEEPFRPDRPAVSMTAGASRVVSHSARHIFAWDGHTGELSGSMTINDFIVQTALLSCGDRLLAFGLSKAVVWDLSTGTRLHELEAYTRTSSAIRIAVATGGDVVAACSESWAFTDRVDPETPAEQESRNVRTSTWDASTGRLLHCTETGFEEMRFGRPEPPCSVAVVPLVPSGLA